MIRKIAGWSLLELLTALACFLVLSVVSTATWRHYSLKLKRDVTVYQVKSGLRYARHEAVAYHTPMIYCGSSDLYHCDGNWHHAAIIKDKYTGTLLKTYVPNTQPISIDFHGNLGHSRWVEFTPYGMTNGQQGHFDICLPDSLLVKNSCQRLTLHFSGEAIS